MDILLTWLISIVIFTLLYVIIYFFFFCDGKNYSRNIGEIPLYNFL